MIITALILILTQLFACLSNWRTWIMNTF